MTVSSSGLDEFHVTQGVACTSATHVAILKGSRRAELESARSTNPHDPLQRAEALEGVCILQMGGVHCKSDTFIVFECG